MFHFTTWKINGSHYFSCRLLRWPISAYIYWFKQTKKRKLGCYLRLRPGVSKISRVFGTWSTRQLKWDAHADFFNVVNCDDVVLAFIYKIFYFDFQHCKNFNKFRRAKIMLFSRSENNTHLMVVYHCSRARQTLGGFPVSEPIQNKSIHNKHWKMMIIIFIYHYDLCKILHIIFFEMYNN